jgi:methionine sulfoxide reductase heme-binding subunit
MNQAFLDNALWALGRGTGVIALVAFTASIVLGIISRSGRSFAGMGRFGVNELHRTASLTGVTLVAVHVSSLFLDPYAQLRLTDVVFPFLSSYRPLWMGLGTLAFDLLGIVVVVSLLRNVVGPRLFRAVHWLTYALWPFALVHSLGTGSDAWSLWMDVVAASCALAVSLAVTWRLLPSYADRGHVRIPRQVAR